MHWCLSRGLEKYKGRAAAAFKRTSGGVRILLMTGYRLPGVDTRGIAVVKRAVVKRVVEIGSGSPALGCLTGILERFQD